MNATQLIGLSSVFGAALFFFGGYLTSRMRMRGMLAGQENWFRENFNYQVQLIESELAMSQQREHQLAGLLAAHEEEARARVAEEELFGQRQEEVEEVEDSAAETTNQQWPVPEEQQELLAQARTRVRDLENEAELLKEQLQEAESRTQHEVARAMERMASLDQHTGVDGDDSREDQVQKLQLRLVKTQEQLRETKNKNTETVQQLEQELRQARTEHRAASDKHDELQRRLAQVTAEQSAAATTGSEPDETLLEELERLERDLQDTRHVMEIQERELGETRRELELVHDEYGTVEQQARGLAQTEGQLARVMEELEAQQTQIEEAKKLQLEVVDLQQTLEKAQQRARSVGTLEDRVRELEQELKESGDNRESRPTKLGRMTPKEDTEDWSELNLPDVEEWSQLNWNEEEEKGELEQLHTELEQTKTRLDDAEAECRELQNTNDGLRHQVAEMEQYCATVEQEKSELERSGSATMPDLGETNENLQEELVGMEQYRTRAEEAERQLENSAAECLELEQLNDRLQSELAEMDQLRTRAEEASEGISDLELALAAAQRERQETVKQLDAAAEEKREAEEVATELQLANDTLKMELEQARSTVEAGIEANQEMERLKKELARRSEPRRSDTVPMSTPEFTVAQRELEETREELQHAEVRVEHLSTVRGELEQRVDALKKALAQARAADQDGVEDDGVEDMESEDTAIFEFHESVITQEIDADDIILESNAYPEEMKAMQARVAEMEQQLKETELLDVELARLRQDNRKLGTVHEEMELLRSQLNTLESENASLRSVTAAHTTVTAEIPMLPEAVELAPGDMQSVVDHLAGEFALNGVAMADVMGLPVVVNGEYTEEIAAVAAHLSKEIQKTINLVPMGTLHRIALEDDQDNVMSIHPLDNHGQGPMVLATMSRSGGLDQASLIEVLRKTDELAVPSASQPSTGE